MPKKRFQLRRRGDGAIVAEEETLADMLLRTYGAINIPLLRNSELYRDSIFIADGSELDDFFLRTLSGGVYNDR